MALSQDQIRSAAARLDQAEKTRKQIRQLSLEYPAITLEDSYAIQKAWVEMKVAQGRVVPLDPDVIFRAGPRVPEAAAVLAAAMHPELAAVSGR